jgi:hypothetical protein
MLTQPLHSISAMREIGRTMTDRGVFELSLSTGQITWANEFALQKLGYSLSDIQSMTIFDIVPLEFHEDVRNNISSSLSGKTNHFHIWPSKSTDAKIIWWYIFETKTHGSTQWTHGDYIQTTDASGVAFAFMRANMATTNVYGQIQNQIDELDTWVHEQVQRLDDENQDMKVVVQRLDDKLNHAVLAAQKAADTSMQTGVDTAALKEIIQNQNQQFEEKWAIHTGEILRLIGSDVVQEKRFSSFEQHVQATTDLAIRAITMQADKAGKGLSRKVTIPVTAIAAGATVAQWFMVHWNSVMRFFGH